VGSRTLGDTKVAIALETVVNALPPPFQGIPKGLFYRVVRGSGNNV
jgi:hypothetical protein